MCEHALGFVGDASSSLAEVTCSSFMYFIVFMSVTDIHLCYVMLKKRGYGSSV